MATWHQQHNKAGLTALYTPDLRRWKVVGDRYGQPASAILFDTQEAAEAYAQKSGEIVIPPKDYCAQ